MADSYMLSLDRYFAARAAGHAPECHLQQGPFYGCTCGGRTRDERRIFDAIEDSARSDFQRERSIAGDDAPTFAEFLVWRDSELAFQA